MIGAGAWLRRAGAPCLVFAAAFVTFLPALGADFVNWDDYDNVVNNEGVHACGRRSSTGCGRARFSATGSR